MFVVGDYNKYMSRSDAHGSVKAIVAFVVLLLAFSVLVLFVQYKDNILFSGNFQSFMMLAIVGMGLLLSLVFLATQTKGASAKRKRSSAKRR